jgi:hypothetical protein
MDTENTPSRAAIFSCKLEDPAPQRQSTPLSYQHTSTRNGEGFYLPHRSEPTNPHAIL